MEALAGAVLVTLLGVLCGLGTVDGGASVVLIAALSLGAPADVVAGSDCCVPQALSDSANDAASPMEPAALANVRRRGGLVRRLVEVLMPPLFRAAARESNTFNLCDSIEAAQ